MALFLQERQNKILELVNREGRVAVADLAQQFQVTEDCIRKDLKQLSTQGMLERIYGGALSLQNLPERNIAKRKTSTEEKRAIAEKAYETIADGDVVYLDVSTTVLALADLIARGAKRCTVVSNSLDTLHILAANPLVTSVGTGGRVHALQNAFIGSTTLQMLGAYTFDRAFLGALSVNVDDGGVTTFESDDGIIKHLAIQHSKQSYLLVESKKFRRNGTFRFADIAEFDCVISESPDEKIVRQMADLGVDCL